jgi:hypothetical protein
VRTVSKNEQSRENGKTGNTRRAQTKQRHKIICVGRHYTQTNTNNVSKKWALLQTISISHKLNLPMGGEWKISYRGLPTKENDIIFACQRTTGTSYIECSFLVKKNKIPSKQRKTRMPITKDGNENMSQ